MAAISEIDAPGAVGIEDGRTEDQSPEEIPTLYRISSYGADYDVHGLVRRLQHDDIYVPPFQRQFVWDIRQASRFVESLLLNLPVPGIFLSKEAETNRLLVVDGQQRLMSLRHFYEGQWPSGAESIEFTLKGVSKPFLDKTYQTLDPQDRRSLDNSIIHATVFKQDAPQDDDSSIYQVFERLNSGGRQLTAQEIRSAVHHSSRFRELLEELNEDPNWRGIYGGPDARLRDRELILRFLALMKSRHEYERPMVTFLNGFMRRYDKLTDAQVIEFRDWFRHSAAFVYRTLGKKAFRPSRSLNAAVFDSVMVATAERLRRGPIDNDQDYLRSYEELLKDEDYMDACARGTASEERLERRMNKATKAFDRI